MSEVLSKAVEAALKERDRASRTDLYFNDPNAWHAYMTGGELWSKQHEINRSVVENRNTAVKAAHGVGKSYDVAVLICWWVDTRYPNAFVASTAPSTAQIGAIVWREVRKLYALIERRYNEGIIDHKLPGKINADAKNNEWKAKDGQLIGFGRKPPEGKEDDNFQGIHDAHVLAVGDEAVGLSGSMIDALGNITSNEDSRRIIIANPTNPASRMGEIFKADIGAWNLITISAFDSPNFTDEKKHLSAETLKRLVGPDYVEDKKKEYGENSARYRARVLGEFAFDTGDTLITQNEINIATNTDIEPSSNSRPQLSVDVARFGDDVSVVYAYQDGQLRYVDSWSKAATTETSRKVHNYALEMGASVVKIDAGGVGGGVVDQVTEMSNGKYIVVGMNSSGASPDKTRWHNARAYWWDTFREQCLKGKIDLDPLDAKFETLSDELMSVEYGYSRLTQGLLIESKDDMRKRGLKSPDFGDAAVMAAADISYLFDDPLNALNPGDLVVPDMEGMGGQNWFIGW